MINVKLFFLVFLKSVLHFVINFDLICIQEGHAFSLCYRFALKTKSCAATISDACGQPKSGSVRLTETEPRQNRFG